jgi:hypothetical protein
MSAYAAYPREVRYGSLMSASLRNLWLIWPQVLAYLAVVGILGLAVPLINDRSTGIIGLFIYFAAQYWLFHSLLKKRGLMQTKRSHYISFVGLAALLILPIILGLAMLIVPGLFLVARWIAAPAFIVARGEGAFAATGISAAAVRGQTGRVMAAIIVLVLIIIAIITAMAGVDRALGIPAITKLLDTVAGHFLPLMLLGLSVATYEQLGPEDTSIEEVFG